MIPHRRNASICEFSLRPGLHSIHDGETHRGRVATRVAWPSSAPVTVPDSIGALLVRNLREGGFSGPVFYVNPRHATSAAAAAYPRRARPCRRPWTWRSSRPPRPRCRRCWRTAAGAASGVRWSSRPAFARAASRARRSSRRCWRWRPGTACGCWVRTALALIRTGPAAQCGLRHGAAGSGPTRAGLAVERRSAPRRSTGRARAGSGSRR